MSRYLLGFIIFIFLTMVAILQSMFGYLIPLSVIIILILISMILPPKLLVWGPSNGPKRVSEILEHMTETEKRVYILRCLLTGLFLGACTVPFFLTSAAIVHMNPTLPSGLIPLLAFPFYSLFLFCFLTPWIKKRQNRFLALTEWAQSQGVKAEEIPLFSFCNRK